MGCLELLVFRSQPCCSTPPEKGTRHLGLRHLKSFPRLDLGRDRYKRSQTMVTRAAAAPAQSTGGITTVKAKGETFC